MCIEYCNRLDPALRKDNYPPRPDWLSLSPKNDVDWVMRNAKRLAGTRYADDSDYPEINTGDGVSRKHDGTNK